MIFAIFAAAAAGLGGFYFGKKTTTPASTAVPENSDAYTILYHLRQTKPYVDSISVLTQDYVDSKKLFADEKVSVDIGIAGYVYRIVKR